MKQTERNNRNKAAWMEKVRQQWIQQDKCPCAGRKTGSCNVSRIWRAPDVCHVYIVHSPLGDLHLGAPQCAGSREGGRERENRERKKAEGEIQRERE